MKLSDYILTGAAIIAMLAAGGCSNSDDWTPGPEDGDAGTAAYFPVPSKTTYAFTVEDAPETIVIPVEVRRNNDIDKAVSVAITSQTTDDAITIPTSVDFAAGEDKAVVNVDCHNMKQSVTANITLALPSDQTDFYSDGVDELTFSVVLSKWELISDNVRYLYSDTNYAAIYPATYDVMYHLEGTKMFKLPDFFGSGLEMTFTIDNPSGCGFFPLQNADFDSYAGQEDSPWFLYDEENVDWPVWTPGDAEGYAPIEFLEFWGTEYYSWAVMLYDPSTLYGYIGLSTGVMQVDNPDTIWGSFQVDFNLKYNPFE